MKNKIEEYSVRDSRGCWIWQRQLNYAGYAIVRIGAKKRRAHRVSYCFAHDLDIDKLPEEVIIRHKCNVRSCVNPDHLCLGTSKDNKKDQLLTTGGTKLNIEAAYEVKKLYEAGVKAKRIAQLFDIHRSEVCAIARGDTWAILNELS